jgi:hypothetical protein
MYLYCPSVHHCYTVPHISRCVWPLRGKLPCRPKWHHFSLAIDHPSGWVIFFFSRYGHGGLVSPSCRHAVISTVDHPLGPPSFSLAVGLYFDTWHYNHIIQADAAHQRGGGVHDRRRPWMFLECSLNVPWMFPEYSLKVLWIRPHHTGSRS